MNVTQLYTNCLAQGAYFIHHNGEAAIIDPLRESQPYLDLLTQHNVKLKYIFETHFHADFVSGHIDLAKKTGAEIVFGPNAFTNYIIKNANDGEVFLLGGLSIQALHTPGHTPESTCYLLLDEEENPQCIFTGDTLFIGDVGRPDLAVDSQFSQEDLAGMLYDSLRNKIMPLPDDITIYPAHGAGSACGKNISKETSDTLGNQKKTNYALGNMSKQQFIKEVTAGITVAPQYFQKNVVLNKSGYSPFDDVLKKGMNALSVEDFEKLSSQHDVKILDVRTSKEFAEAHIPGSLFIGLEGQFAPWVGSLIEDMNQYLLIVAPVGKEAETVMRLARVGYDNCLGFLQGGFNCWNEAKKAVTTIKSISAESFLESFLGGNTGNNLSDTEKNIIDVRKPSEFEVSHIANAANFPLDDIYAWSKSLNVSTPYIVHCAGGYRSMIAASILMQQGVTNITDIEGGYSAITKVEKNIAIQ
jgi:hydroxyacylglutathione hydrolase